jgi:hypothetical protein
MSEIAIQGLIDGTKAVEQDEEAMDMTVISGVRMSKYDIIALRVGLKVKTGDAKSPNRVQQRLCR